MIKASGEIDGRPFLILGLSHENITRLMAGKPIAFEGEQYGCAGEVVIMYGKTEDDIAEKIKEVFFEN